MPSGDSLGQKFGSGFNLTHSMTEDEFIIVPSESVFSLKEWKHIRAGAAKGAEAPEKGRLSETILRKFPVKAYRKPGPRPDLPRQSRQNFLWTFRQIIGGSVKEMDESDVWRRACLVIHNFDQVCDAAVFLDRRTIDCLRNAAVASNTEAISLEERRFWLEASAAARASRHLSWEDTQLGEITISEKEGPCAAAELGNVSILSGSVLPHLLNMSGLEFRVLARNRKRKGNAGRPREEQNQSFEIKGADGKKHRISLGSTNSFQDKTQPMNPPPSEAEILDNAFGRLLLVKNFIFKLLPLRLPIRAWDQVVSYHDDKWHPALPQTRQACEDLWTAAHRQPRRPWEERKSPESAGDSIGTQPFGVLNCDF